MYKKAEILNRIQLRQSTIKDWLNCPLMFRFRHIEGLKPTFQNLAALHGSALHLAIHRLHEYGFNQDLGKLYQAAFDIVRMEHSSIPIQWKQGEEADIARLKANAIEILKGYTAYSENQIAEILYSEVRFRVKIKGYRCTGTMDQVRRNSDGNLDLIDLKSGMQRPNMKSLPVDWQLSLYAYALKYGELFVQGVWTRPRLTVNRTVIYFLRAHERYKRNSKYGQKGDEKGRPLMACEKPVWDLTQFKQDFLNLVKMMTRDWPFPNPNACGFCAYHQNCYQRTLFHASSRIQRVQRDLAELGMVEEMEEETNKYDY
jgi:RecB family exonuclease